MKLYLDDWRPTPEGWTHAYSVNQAKRLIQEADVWEDASFDGDLGEYFDDGGDGWRLVQWMIEEDIWPIKKPTCHSGNPYMNKRMTEDIERYWHVR